MQQGIHSVDVAADQPTSILPLAEPPLMDELAATLADVRAFCDDPIALLERALYLVRKARIQIAFAVALALGDHVEALAKAATSLLT